MSPLYGSGRDGVKPPRPEIAVGASSRRLLRPTCADCRTGAVCPAFGKFARPYGLRPTEHAGRRALPPVQVKPPSRFLHEATAFVESLLQPPMDKPGAELHHAAVTLLGRESHLQAHEPHGCAVRRKLCEPARAVVPRVDARRVSRRDKVGARPDRVRGVARAHQRFGRRRRGRGRQTHQELRSRLFSNPRGRFAAHHGKSPCSCILGKTSRPMATSGD